MNMNPVRHMGRRLHLIVTLIKNNLHRANQLKVTESRFCVCVCVCLPLLNSNAVTIKSLSAEEHTDSGSSRGASGGAERRQTSIHHT